MSAKELLEAYSELDVQIEQLEESISKLSARKRELESRANEIKADIKNDMLSAGMKKATIHGWKINISTSTSTLIEEMDMIPEDFWKVKKEPDVMKIKEYLKDGWSVDGARLVKNQNINLKRQ